MTTNKVLLAIEAMSEIDRMAQAAEKYGYSLVVLAENVPSYGAVEKATLVEFPTRDFAALSDYIQDNRSRIAQVFSVTDTWGVQASQLRDQFDFLQFGSTERLRQLRDKQYVQETLIKAGLAREVSGYPRILKAKNGTGKIGVHYVGSEQELRGLVEKNGLDLGDYLQQNYYCGSLYSAEVWRDKDVFQFFGVTNRILSEPPFFTEKVKSFPWECGSEWEKNVESWVSDVLAQLDYDFGLAHVEFVETRHGFEIVEINCRMAGALITPAIVASTNFDPYRMVVEQALGLPVTIPDTRIVSGGSSHVSLYAQRVGRLSAIEGLDKLDQYLGDVQWHTSKDIGDEISELGTYRARIGNVSAQASSAPLAQDRAITAAATLTPLIDFSK
ncbi:MAG: hypothetical protein IKS49_05730 [Actinomycetaceae bacterium]|nr:hypothetical protein [Actinomycetaceae bacterium]